VTYSYYFVAGFSDKLILMNLLIDDLRPYKEFSVRNAGACAFRYEKHILYTVMAMHKIRRLFLWQSYLTRRPFQSQHNLFPQILIKRSSVSILISSVSKKWYTSVSCQYQKSDIRLIQYVGNNQVQSAVCSLWVFIIQTLI